MALTAYVGNSGGEMNRVLAVSHASTLPALAPTVTAPTTEGTFDRVGPTGAVSAAKLKLVPFGTDADNETFTMRAVGWNQVGTLWVPTVLWESLCTLSTAVGVAAASVINTEFFCDTIAATTAGMGVANVDNVITSPADDTPAHVVIDCRGSQRVQVIFALGTGAGANALYAWI